MAGPADDDRALQLSPRVRANLPEWLYDDLVARHGEAFTTALGDAWLRPAPLDLRVNTAKISREEALAELETAGIGAEIAPMSPAGIRLKGKPALNQLPLFINGGVEVQDEEQPAAVPPRGAQAWRDGRGFLRGRGRQDAVTGRCHALDGPALRL